MTLVSTDRETRRNGTTGMMTRMKDFIANRRACHKLHQLDDRMLADIGLRRGEIDSKVWSR